MMDAAKITQLYGRVLVRKTPDESELLADIVQFLSAYSILPSLQISRASQSLRRTLEWQRFNRAETMDEALAIVKESGIAHITRLQGKFVLWVIIDERVIKGFASSHEDFMTRQGLMHLGLAAMESLAKLEIQEACTGEPINDQAAACVVEFRLAPIPAAQPQRVSSRDMIIQKLSDLVSSIDLHYPSLLDIFYVINPSEEYLLTLGGKAVPVEYGGESESLFNGDYLVGTEITEQNPQSPGQITASGGQDVDSQTISGASAVQTAQVNADITGSGPGEPRLIFSEKIGPPTIILDPEDLESATELCPGKMGARIVWADDDMLVKYGHGVRLAEAEAMHLVSNRTSIPIPRLLSAYILDGVGHIVMSYEEGEPLDTYWDRASEPQQENVLHQLQDYVTQMRSIIGRFIGGIDSSPCRDGIFEGGYGDYESYRYGPYASEPEFNEGVVQALRDRLPPESRDEVNRPDSAFSTREYIMYQTFRELHGHSIVFTHGDLHPGNLLVRADGVVVVLDWGLAGYWPEYWEFYRAMFNPPWRPVWDRMIEKFIPPYYVECELMKKVFGIVWN
ncbi:aminoglycoside phosphotransferase family protein [Aspergillus aculeatinus CBS 121060]|uniref:Kinase-like protein n=1 Tax=Aspergillus aculeatinus CBS 121060 TaxID=1448322 RepID=A0ACD1GV22_9EURO|nr:kinase-like protein [Aspergillus aculeatinus CBS 121060]RAH65217.1 kinase-like protein [Aspergillus aculeatinus CBS 121060]